MAELNRRDWLKAVGCLACAAALGGSWTWAAEGEAGKVSAGNLADYPADGIWDAYRDLQGKRGFFLIRQKGRLYAMTAICTHKNQTLKLKAGIITCPAHGSQFDAAGVPRKPPAKRWLSRYGISADDAGQVMVDTGRVFHEGQWEEAGAFIELPEQPPSSGPATQPAE